MGTIRWSAALGAVALAWAQDHGQMERVIRPEQLVEVTPAPPVDQAAIREALRPFLEKTPPPQAAQKEPKGGLGGFPFPNSMNNYRDRLAADGAAGNLYTLNTVKNAFPATYDILISGRPLKTTAANALEWSNSAVSSTLDTLNTVFSSGGSGAYRSLPSMATPTFGGFQSQAGFVGAMARAYAAINQPHITGLLSYNSSQSNLNFGAAYLQNYWASLYQPSRAGLGILAGTGVGFDAPIGRAAAPQGFGPIATRWRQLAEQQTSIYYSDPALSDLRVQGTKLLLAAVYADPWYLYYQQLLKQLQEQIYVTRPSYSALVTLAGQVAALTVPPDKTTAVLNQHANARQQLQVLSRQVWDEVLAYLLFDTATAQWMSQVQAFLSQRYAANTQTPAFQQAIQIHDVLWQAALLSAYQNSTLPAAVNQFFADYPGMAEYYGILTDIQSALSSLQSNATVVQQANQVSNLENALTANEAARQGIASAYSQYLAEVNGLLGSTAFAAETERYWQRINGLLLNDPFYQALATFQYPVAASLLDVQSSAAELTGLCVAALGNGCDPFKIPAITSLLTSQSTVDAISGGALFQETYDLFQVLFSYSSGYLAAQSQAASAVQAAVSPVAGAIDSARRRYVQRVESIPAVVQLLDARNQLGFTIRNLPALKPKFDRLQQLAAQVVADNCAYTLNAPGQNFAAAGGTTTVTVTTGSGCPWDVTGLPAWVTIQSINSTQVQLTVAANTGAASRSATLTIAGQPFALQQAGTCAGACGPAIVAPGAGQTINVSGVTFQWNATSGAGYGLRITRSGAAVFEGTLLGSASTGTLVSLPDGSYVFSVRACSSQPFGDSTCGAFSSVAFAVAQTAPPAAPAITSPSPGQNFTSSTQTFSWTSVSNVNSYQVELRDQANGGVLELSLANSGSPPATSTIYSMHSSASYSLRVRACQSACGPWSGTVNFSVTLPAVPTATPAAPACALSGNRLNCSWNSVANADFYTIHAIHPTAFNGGALTVASRRTTALTTASPEPAMLVPDGPLAIIVAGCNGNGCGPYSSAANVNAAGGNPASPVLGNPVSGSVVTSNPVFFSWNRIPGDTGSNTVYRLYVQDFSRSAPALDIYTTANFYAAAFRGGGSRYDAVVVANPGAASQIVGAAAGFVVTAGSPASPTMVQPGHETPSVISTVPAGNVTLGWTPVPGATIYEYFVAVAGQPNASARGVTPGLLVQVPLAVSSNTRFNGIVRACPAGSSCAFGSDAGWGPWSNAPGGPGITSFTVRP